MIETLLEATQRLRATGGDDLIAGYRRAAGRHPLLTPIDEVRLAQAIETGRQARQTLTDTTLTPVERRERERLVHAGDDARETFIVSNLRLVLSIARRSATNATPILDVVQDGNIGLMRAVDKFDWRKGFKFSTYATWWIRQAITRGAVNGGRTIRLPVAALDHVKQLNITAARLEGTLGRRPTTAELAAELGMSTAEVVHLQRHLSAPASLSQPVGDTGELQDLIADPDAVAPDEAATAHVVPDEVRTLLSNLDDRERSIIELRYGISHGQACSAAEVGRHLNLSRERIRQIERRAMAKLRHPACRFGFHDLAIPSR